METVPIRVVKTAAYWVDPGASRFPRKSAPMLSVIHAEEALIESRARCPRAGCSVLGIRDENFLPGF